MCEGHVFNYIFDLTVERVLANSESVQFYEFSRFYNEDARDPL